MVEGLFALGGVLLGGIITALTNYFLYNLTIKNNKEKQLVQKKQEIYLKLQEYMQALITAPTNDSLFKFNIDNLYSSLAIYASKDILMEVIELNKIIEEYDIKSKNFNLVKDKVINKSTKITKLIRSELQIPEI